MPSLQAVKDFRTTMFNDSMALIDKKGHDYNRLQQEAGDTLFNLSVAALLGIVPTAEQGILVRLSDKFMRLISLMAPGVEAKVSGESVRDTVKDIHNYVDYALQLWEERKKKSAGEALRTMGTFERNKTLIEQEVQKTKASDPLYPERGDRSFSGEYRG